jgi:hypothetical protein
LIDTGDAGWAECQDTSGSWVKRDHVFVTFDREYRDFEATLEGALSPEGFGSVNGEFGPEVGFGFELGNQLLLLLLLGKDVVIIKASGVSALAAD